tara:strand:- start:86 stop:1753 length:1668 start_codon:yes stop_codon:yes gene_type:complete
MLEEKEPTIFISYSWKDFEIANKIEKDLDRARVKVTRDLKMEYKDSISNFMKKITEDDYALLLISESYLKSSNCMYEVLELLKEQKFEKKILPIILPKTNIFNPSGQLEIIKYWQEEIKKLNNKIKELDDLSNIEGITKDINHLNKIRASISDFISKIKDLNCKSFDELNENNYRHLLDYIGIESKDISSSLIGISKIENLAEREYEIDKLLEKNPKNINILFFKAKLAFEEKKYKKAQNLILNLIENNKLKRGLYLLLGFCCKEQNQIQKAIEYCNKEIELYPDSYLSYLVIASFQFYNLNETEKAEENLKLCIQLDKNSGATYNIYAELLLKKNRFQEAELNYKKALALSSSFENHIYVSDIHYSLAHLYQTNLNKFHNAKKHYKYCLELNPKNFKAHCNLAVLLKNIFKDYETSSFHYNEAHKINPKDPITLNNLGNIYQHHLNKKELAKYHYEKAIEFDENYSDPYNGLGKLLEDSFPKKSKYYYEKGISIDPKNAILHHNYALLLLEKFNDIVKAKEYYIKSISLNPYLISDEKVKLFDIKIVKLGFDIN